jgi:hypothetical protein
MTPVKVVEKAFDNAQLVIAEYIQPGPRDAERTLERLIDILDDPDLYGALVELHEGERPKLAPL